ncbi:menaquinol oxidoreductase [Clostridiales bacterium PH28_bin88]|nr:menaquinol oxidoreductase [Clostridiales bacterium PH28_bin88]
MYNERPILAGLAIFLGLITFPFWYGMGKAAPAPEPNLDTPAIRQLQVKECVEATTEMRARHMQLLNDWRNWVVRDGNRVYVAENGKRYEMSLQNTCLECHSSRHQPGQAQPVTAQPNQAEFCDTCHNYAGVKPDCWTCHVVPKEERR